jgi:hypothetical protein
VDQAPDLGPLFALPPEVLVHRFRQFVIEFSAFNMQVDKLMLLHAPNKPNGWAGYVELHAGGSQEAAPQPPSGPAGPGIPLDSASNWRNWIAQLGQRLDVDLLNTASDWTDVRDALHSLHECRLAVIQRLSECGLNRAALESLADGSADPKIVLAFV